MTEKKKSPSTFVQDPFGLPAIEVSDAQESTEEIALNDAELAQQIAEDQALEAEQKKLQDEVEEDPVLTLGENGEVDAQELQSCIETLLFLMDKPLPLKKMRELIASDLEATVYEEAIAALKERYSAYHHGIELVEVGGGFQFRTKLHRAPVARKIARVVPQRLSRGAMESLAIVAYKQPVMKEDIDKVRGVDSSHFIRGLLEKKLICISGRSELPGRPMLYSTTQEFLEIFGIKDLQSMPPLREIEKMIPTSEVSSKEEVDPRVRQMQKLVHEMGQEKDRIDYNAGDDQTLLDEIRERVKGIAVSTPYLEEQKALAKQQEEESSQ